LSTKAGVSAWGLYPSGMLQGTHHFYFLMGWHSVSRSGSVLYLSGILCSFCPTSLREAMLTSPTFPETTGTGGHRLLLIELHMLLWSSTRVFVLMWVCESVSVCVLVRVCVCVCVCVHMCMCWNMLGILSFSPLWASPNTVC
jgi:hypothetical protein